MQCSLLVESSDSVYGFGIFRRKQQLLSFKCLVRSFQIRLRMMIEPINSNLYPAQINAYPAIRIDDTMILIHDEGTLPLTLRHVSVYNS